MNKTLMAVLGGTLAGVLLTTQVAGPLVAQEAGKSSTVYEQLDLFGDIFERIRAQYVEPVDSQELVEAAINGMLTSLDPHSSYIAANDFEDMQVQTKGEFGGLGIEVTQEEGVIKVVSPMDGTPADKAGIKAGDFITHVDGESVMGLTLDEAVDKMRGPVGREIVITIVREGVDRPLRRVDHPRHHQADRRQGPRRRQFGGAARVHLQRPDLPRPAKKSMKKAGRRAAAASTRSTASSSTCATTPAAC